MFGNLSSLVAALLVLTKKVSFRKSVESANGPEDFSRLSLRREVTRRVGSVSLAFIVSSDSLKVDWCSVDVGFGMGMLGEYVVGGGCSASISGRYFASYATEGRGFWSSFDAFLRSSLFAALIICFVLSSVDGSDDRGGDR